MKERRVHHRVMVGFGAEVHTAEGVVPAATRDLSCGGCRLAADAALPEGGPYVIELKLTVDGIQENDYPVLRVKGSVRWTAEGEDDGELVFLSGIQFEELTEAQGEWLTTVMKTHGEGEA